MRFAAGFIDLSERPTHDLKGTTIDERPNERTRIARIADRNRGIDLSQVLQ